MRIFDSPLVRSMPAVNALQNVEAPKPEHVRSCLLDIAKALSGRVIVPPVVAAGMLPAGPRQRRFQGGAIGRLADAADGLRRRYYRICLFELAAEGVFVGAVGGWVTVFWFAVTWWAVSLWVAATVLAPLLLLRIWNDKASCLMEILCAAMADEGAEESEAERERRHLHAANTASLAETSKIIEAVHDRIVCPVKPDGFKRCTRHRGHHGPCAHWPEVGEPAGLKPADSPAPVEEACSECGGTGYGLYGMPGVGGPCYECNGP